MLFVAICKDRSDAGSLRGELRPQHLIWLQEKGAQARLAGPLLDEAAESAEGSLLIMEYPDLESARADLSQDPYAQGGLFQSVEIRPFLQVFPTSP